MYQYDLWVDRLVPHALMDTFRHHPILVENPCNRPLCSINDHFHNRMLGISWYWLSISISNMQVACSNIQAQSLHIFPSSFISGSKQSTCGQAKPDVSMKQSEFERGDPSYFEGWSEKKAMPGSISPCLSDDVAGGSQVLHFEQVAVLMVDGAKKSAQVLFIKYFTGLFHLSFKAFHQVRSFLLISLRNLVLSRRLFSQYFVLFDQIFNRLSLFPHYADHHLLEVVCHLFRNQKHYFLCLSKRVVVFHDSVLCDLHVGKIVSKEVHEIFRFSKKDAFVSRRCYKFLINQQLKGPERLFVEEFNLKFRKAIDLPHAHFEISVILLVGV